MPNLTGSCFCGECRFVFDGDLSDQVYHCHCSKCRTWSGGNAFRTSTTGRRCDLVWTSGENDFAVFDYDAKLNRYFCPRCHTSLISTYPDSDLFRIGLGLFEEDLGVRPIAHIFVGSKAAWFQIPDDGLPQYEAGPGSRLLNP
jgi:hypothetical protein